MLAVAPIGKFRWSHTDKQADIRRDSKMRPPLSQQHLHLGRPKHFCSPDETSRLRARNIPRMPMGSPSLAPSKVAME
jgi:hypothetical protein